MRQLLLSIVLIAVPVAVFAAGYLYLAPPKDTVVASLGDLSTMKTIVADIETIAATGDLQAAKQRATDFESTWDDAEATLRPLDAGAWGVIDAAADATFHALRAATPDPATVTASLTVLMSTLDNPSPADGSATGITQVVAGIAVTDASGHAIPCEEMLKSLRSAISGRAIASANLAIATDLRTKATERCNADDDTRADAFSAQGLALAANS